MSEPPLPPPIPATPLGYQSQFASPEWTLIIRILVIVSGIVAVGRVLSIFGYILYIYGLGYSSTSLLMFASIGTGVTGIVLGIGVILALQSQGRGLTVMVIAEWINLGIAGLRIVISIVQYSGYIIKPSSGLSSAYYIGNILITIFGAIASCGFSLLVMTLIRAYRRANPLMR